MPSDKKRGRPPHADQLTPTEWRVVQSAQHGLSNTDIAKRLGISINAVKFHIANAIGKTGVKNKRALLKWVGIPMNSAAYMSAQINEVNMKHTALSVGQIARSVENVEKSERWYREILGLDHLYTFGTMAFFDADGVRIMLSQAEKEIKDESIIYFKTPDIQSHYQHLQKSGVNFSHVPHKIHQHQDGSEEWMAFFTDLENRPLGLMCTYKTGE